MRIGKILLAAMLIIALFPLASGDVGIQAGGIIKTVTSTIKMYSTTTVMFFSTGSDTTTYQNLVHFNNNGLEPITYYILSGRLYLYADCFAIIGGCDPAQYYFAIDANKIYNVAVRWDLNNTKGDTPSVYVNGKSQALTMVTAGDGLVGTDSNAQRFFGYTYSGTQPFLGSIANMTLCGSKISNTHLKNITGSYMADIMQQYASLDYNCFHSYDFQDATFRSGYWIIKDRMGKNDYAYGAVDLNIVNESYVGGVLSRW